MNVSPEDHEKLRLLWEHGVSIKRLAGAMGVTVSQMRCYIRGHRADFPARTKTRRITEGDMGEIARMRGEGMSYRRIADALGISRKTVERYARRLGVGGHLGGKRVHLDRATGTASCNDEDYATLVAMYREGATDGEMADAMGVSVTTIQKLTRHHRDDFPKRVTKVSPDEKARIRELSRSGMTHADIAREVGRHHDTVSKVLNARAMSYSEYQAMRSYMTHRT